MAPIVTGDVNPAALEDLVRLCVELDRLRHHPRTGTGSPGDGDGQPVPPQDTARAWEALERAIIGKAVDLLSGPGGLASFLRRHSSAPGSQVPACHWTSGSARPSRPGSATRSGYREECRCSQVAWGACSSRFIPPCVPGSRAGSRPGRPSRRPRDGGRSPPAATADRGADRVRQDPRGVPGLHRPVLPRPRFLVPPRSFLRARGQPVAGRPCGANSGTRRTAGGVRVAAEGAGDRHSAEPRGAAARDRRDGRSSGSARR